MGSEPFEMDWDIPDYGSYSIHAVATDDENLTAVSLTATINVYANVIDIQISEKTCGCKAAESHSRGIGVFRGWLWK